MADTKTQKPTPLQAAQALLDRKRISEDAHKLWSLVSPRDGTHDGYRRVEHRASQRSVERLQAKILVLRGVKQAPTSSDRAECRALAEALAKIGKFKGSPVEAYRRARARNLGAEWLGAAARRAPAALAALWAADVKSAEVQSAIKLAARMRHLNVGD